MPYPEALNALPGVPGRFTLQVGAEHPAFEGHFPGDPILPGLIQVDWALRLAYETFGCTGAFRGLEHLKFQGVIRPSEPIELGLSWDPAARHLAFRYSGQAGLKSQGTALFSQTP